MESRLKRSSFLEANKEEPRLPFIDVEVGVTMHIGDPRQNEYMRYSVSAKGLLADKDSIDEQLQRLNYCVDATTMYLMEKLNEEINKQLGVQVIRTEANTVVRKG